jgi:deazaflavin-dependent oxidoreductase (nitroreductase family)
LTRAIWAGGAVASVSYARLVADGANDWNTRIIDEFRANKGQVGGQFVGAPMLLLTTTGAKSGRQRTNPMMYLADRDRLIVFASKAGAPTNPDWYHNLVANPDVTVEVGAETFEATAETLIGAERDALYATQAERYPGFAEYEAQTTRVIPVVALRRH